MVDLEQNNLSLVIFTNFRVVIRKHLHGRWGIPVFAWVIILAHLHAVVVAMFADFDLCRLGMAHCVTAGQRILRFSSRALG